MHMQRIPGTVPVQTISGGPGRPHALFLLRKGYFSFSKKYSRGAKVTVGGGRGLRPFRDPLKEPFVECLTQDTSNPHKLSHAKLIITIFTEENALSIKLSILLVQADGCINVYSLHITNFRLPTSKTFAVYLYEYAAEVLIVYEFEVMVFKLQY